MVRAANTGVTCLVNEFGRVTEMLRDDKGSTFEEGTVIGDLNIPIDPALTFYARHGELFAKICAGAAGIIAVAKLLIALGVGLKRGKIANPGSSN